MSELVLLEMAGRSFEFRVASYEPTHNEQQALSFEHPHYSFTPRHFERSEKSL
jgi:hypothetical protein